METSAARTTAVRLINNGRNSLRLSKITLSDNAKFRGMTPQEGMGLPPMSSFFWEIEWSGEKPAGQPKPTELEFNGDSWLAVSLLEGQPPTVKGIQVQMQPSHQPNTFDITIR